MTLNHRIKTARRQGRSVPTASFAHAGRRLQEVPRRVRTSFEGSGLVNLTSARSS